MYGWMTDGYDSLRFGSSVAVEQLLQRRRQLEPVPVAERGSVLYGSAEIHRAAREIGRADRIVSGRDAVSEAF